jgi:eukaryotic-like serine/threonine-protein kinase
MTAMPHALLGAKPSGADPFRGTPFSVVERLAAGGMGEVFIVLHRELGREFVAKLLLAEHTADARMLDRMRVEAQTLGSLNHPNIVSVTGFGSTQDGRPFIVMERLRGCTLAAELAARGALPVLEALGYIRQLLSALAAAHAVGVVHRDVKPANLFLVPGAEGARTLHVLDFGLARVLPGAAAGAPKPLSLPTGTGKIVGTPHFLSPEGVGGVKVDERADLYCAGLVLYALVAGRGPFDHLNTRPEVFRAHAQAQPAAPSLVGGRALPAALDRLVLYALRKDPSHRFQSAAQFDRALAQLEEALRADEATACDAPLATPAQVKVSPIERTPWAALSRYVAGRAQQLGLFLAILATTAALVSLGVRFVLGRWT